MSDTRYRKVPGSRLAGFGQLAGGLAGDMLPAEVSAIMARLRDGAHRMPPAQFNRVLTGQWGADWRRRFASFEPTAIAAASIAQVLRAVLHDGRVVAVEVQYPGVADSIDADVDNVATLLRMSGLLPDSLDVRPLLMAAFRTELCRAKCPGLPLRIPVRAFGGDAQRRVGERELHDRHSPASRLRGEITLH